MTNEQILKKAVEKAKWELACLARQNIKNLPAFGKDEIEDSGLYIKRQDAVDALKSDKLPIVFSFDYDDEDTVNTVSSKGLDTYSRN